MKTLERSELKKLNGGTDGSGDHYIQCWCPNGNYVNCGTHTDTDCFDIVYFACGGQPATQCSYT